MRSYNLLAATANAVRANAFLRTAAFGMTAVTASPALAATPNNQWDFPAAVQEKDPELGTLPDRLPVEGEATPAPAPSPVPTKRAQVPQESPAIPKAADTVTPAIPGTGVTSSFGESAADTMTPEQSVDIPTVDPLGPAAPESVSEAPTTPVEPGVMETPEMETPEPEEIESAAAPHAPEPREDITTVISRRTADRVYRPYYDEKPTMAFQFSGSMQALGEKYRFQGTSPDEFNVKGFTLAYDIQPKFLQAFGVISFGPTFSFYPFSIVDETSTDPDATDGPFDVHAFGATVKYQAYWFKGQPLVPYVGYEWQFASYKFLPDDSPGAINTGLEGNTTLSGVVWGAMLQLQWMEHSAAYEAYQEWGMKRSYLLFEAKKLTSAEGVLDTIGNSYWFGLRVEI